MNTLLLRLSGPMQSWGISSKFNSRNTEKEPSKSGVIGMLASALGRQRDQPVDDLAALRFGVRTDQIGGFLRDYHTAHHPDNEKLAYITNRHYLIDSTFLVGLEGDRDLLEVLDSAIRHPYYPLYLGRRSCPPSGRISLGIRDVCLEDALSSEPWLASDWYARKQPDEVFLDVSMDSVDATGFIQRDSPLSFSQRNRTYATRQVSFIPMSVRVMNERSRLHGMKTTEHDPFVQFREGVRCIYHVSN